MSVDESDAGHLHKVGTLAIIKPQNTVTTQPTQSVAKGTASHRLAPVPLSVAGESPYFVSQYAAYASQLRNTANFTECSLVCTDFVAESQRCYSRHDDHRFRWCEALASMNVIAVPDMAKTETWEKLEVLEKELFEATVPWCEHCVVHGHDLFATRNVPLHPALRHITSTAPLKREVSRGGGSYVHSGLGVFIRVWRCHSSAKRFVAACRSISMAIQDAQLHGVASATTLLSTVFGITVTVTPLLPLISTSSLSGIEGAPLLVHGMDRLEVITRSSTPIAFYPGADGRIYCVAPVDVLFQQGPLTGSLADGEPKAYGRFELAQRRPQLVATFPSAVDAEISAEIDIAASNLLGSITSRFDTSAVGSKILDLLAEGFVPQVLHDRGVPLRRLYQVMESPVLASTSDPFAITVRSLCLNEMICRTTKELIRADVAHNAVQPAMTGPSTVVVAFILEVVNRAVYSLFVRTEFWDGHFLPVLRAKYGTPEAFAPPQTSVTKRAVAAFLAEYIGALFEGGKFVKLVAVNHGSTLPGPSPTLRRFLDGAKAIAHKELLEFWRQSVSTISDAPAALCCMLREISTFAASKHPQLSEHIGQLELKVNSMGDDVITGSALGTITPCRLQLPDSLAVAQVTLTKYLSFLASRSTLFTDTAKKTQHLDPSLSSTLIFFDLFDVIERYRIIINLLQREKQTRGKAQDLLVSALPPLLILIGNDVFDSALMSDSQYQLMGDVVGASIHKASTFAAWVDTVDDMLRGMRKSWRTDARRERWLDLARGATGAALSAETCNAVSKQGATTLQMLAEDGLKEHVAFFGQSDHRTHIMLVIAAAHIAKSLPQRYLSDAQVAATNNFSASAAKCEAALPSEQRNILRAEWFLQPIGTVADVLMQNGRWSAGNQLLALAATSLAGNTFRSKQSRDTSNSPHAALLGVQPFDEAAQTLKKGVDAAMLFQKRFRERVQRRQEEATRKQEEAAKLQRMAAEREAFIKKRLPLQTIAQLADIYQMSRSRYISAPQMPHVPVNLTFPSVEASLHGLFALIAVAPPKKCINLCALAVQSDLLPPVRWTISPIGGGARALVVSVATENWSHWFHPRMLAPVDWTPLPASAARSVRFAETAIHSDHVQTFFYAKCIGVHIFAQNKYTFLKWCICGGSWAGPVAQCLTALLPSDRVSNLVTFGSPPAFSSRIGMPSVPNAHVFDRRDVVAFLPCRGPLGVLRSANDARVVPRAWQSLISKLSGLGVQLSWSPDPTWLIERFSSYVHLGPHEHVLWTSNEQVNQHLKGDSDDDSDGSVVAPGDEDRTAEGEDGEGRQETAAAAPLPTSEKSWTRHFCIKCNNVGKFFDVRVLGIDVATTNFYRQALANCVSTRQAIREAVVERKADAYDLQALPRPDSMAEMPKVRTLHHLGQWLTLVDRFGYPSADLQQRITMPARAEPLVADAGLLVLAYPRLAHALLIGETYVPDNYGVNTLPNLELISDLEASTTVADCAAILSRFRAASWDVEWVATQLFELSGLEKANSSAATGGGDAVVSPDGRSAPAIEAPDARNSGSASRRLGVGRRMTVGLQRRTVTRGTANDGAGSPGCRNGFIAPTVGNELYGPLIEHFVECHNFLYSIPLKSRRPEPEAEDQTEPVHEVALTAPQLAEKLRRDRFVAVVNSVDGYHLGWTVAIASAVRSSGKTTLLQALMGCQGLNRPTSGIVALPLASGSVPLRRGEGESQTRTSAMEAVEHGVPYLRFQWTPTPKPRASTGPSADDTSNFESQLDATETSFALPEYPAHVSGASDGHKHYVLQTYFAEVRYDGKMASKSMLSRCAQSVWVVSDEYTFTQTIERVNLRQDARLAVIVYCPRVSRYNDATQPPSTQGLPQGFDPRVADAIKQYCIRHALPYAVVDVSSQESVESLQLLLVQWMAPSLRLPVLPHTLPEGVELGELCAFDMDAIASSYLKRAQDARGALRMGPEVRFEAAKRAAQFFHEKPTKQLMISTQVGGETTAPPPLTSPPPRPDLPQPAHDSSQHADPIASKKSRNPDGLRAAAAAARAEIEEEERQATLKQHQDQQKNDTLARNKRK